MNLDNKTLEVWFNAPNCYCGCEPQDSSEDHKLCAICGKTMVYCAHESVASQINSRGRWNTDHRIPLSFGGSNDISNLQAVHVKCNREKGSNISVLQYLTHSF